ncbi:putative uridine kinase family protein [Lyophyllum shimeji]|uniref:Uridine kinase n=1 Tax=Lyophyllum shimeji TaxID=47721 RepID=A0A9P3UPK3_LYOSH|nr:putative uridine kinase family protein [Lyophyllum shimeji]
MPNSVRKHSFDESEAPTEPSPQYLSLQPKKNTVLVSHGRPPWYGEDGKRTCDAYVVAVAGGSGSGKTHVARQIVQSLGSIPTVIILSQDSFYKYHTPEELELAHANKLDFDHPDAIDMPLFAACLADLKACKQTNIPVYSFVEHQRLPETKYLYGATIIITEGIMALHDPALRELYDLKVFVQCDSDLMLARRIQRDVKERGRSVESVLDQYLRFVKPSYDNFVRPTATYADIIVPGSNNAVAIGLISAHIRRQLDERANQFRKKLAIPHLYFSGGSGASTPESRLEDLDLKVLPQTPQLVGIYTILRSKETSRQDFVFFADRLSTLLVEHALQYLPYTDKTVTTPVGVVSHGKKLDVKNVCGVSVLRSGGALERGFRRVINDVPVGSLLVQSDATTGEPLLLHAMLPHCVRFRHLAEESWVFLLDAQIGTAAAAFMSIRILLDHGVREDRIVFITFLVARGGGISVLRRVFPQVTIVCGAVDDEMREGWLEGYRGEGNPEGTGRPVWVMQPGMGQIGDRYYL